MTSAVKIAIQFASLRVQIACHFSKHSVGGRLVAAQEFRHGFFGPVVLSGERIQAHAFVSAKAGDIANQAIDRHASWDAAAHEKETSRI